MKFRKANPNDAKQILTVTHTAFLRYAREVGQSVSGTTETMDDVLFDIENKHVIVCEDENQNIIGCVRCEKLENIVYISRLASISQSKDVNVGNQLIEKVKESSNADALCLHTSTKIQSLVMFYYRSGFFINSVSHKRGYPRGLFVCNLTDNKNIDYDLLTKNK